MVKKLNKQPAALLRFISAFDVNPDNTVISNVLDEEATFVSKFYTPNLRVSVLATKTLGDLGVSDILKVNRDMNAESLTSQIMKSDLRTTKPAIFQMAKLVILEAFSIVYAVTEKEELLKYLDAEEIATTRENLKYILDALGGNSSYSKMTQSINKLDIALGYVQAQVPVLRGDVG